MKKISLNIMAVFYMAAGVNHFINPDFYLKMMPTWIPWHKELVFISGLFEILFGFFLLFPFSGKMAAWCIIALLVAVFPANIQMMLNAMDENNPRFWITVLRLPLQILLIRWAYGFTKP
ncbi:MAG: DoxX family protein [Chitinophagaceae bacterium]|nr:DoxX family protein [Chitinophagaceae bacterium]